MLESEKNTTSIFRTHYTELLDPHKCQNRYLQWAAWLNPFLAIRELSMAVAGTDFEHYEHFQWAAESYRFELVQESKRSFFHRLSRGPEGLRGLGPRTAPLALGGGADGIGPRSRFRTLDDRRDPVRRQRPPAPRSGRGDHVTHGGLPVMFRRILALIS